MFDRNGGERVYPQAYLEYLFLFHVERDYFECHEVLEEYWKDTGQKDNVWVGLIQIAVAFYHHRRGNYSGAIKSISSALEILKREGKTLNQLGLKSQALIALLTERRTEMIDRAPYKSMELPLLPDVKTICLQRCAMSNVSWNQASDLTNDYLLHKHKLRDRSDVIRERERQLKAKRRMRNQST